MADRQDTDPRGGEYRQAPRSSSERRQVPRDGGEFRQAPRSSGERRQAPRDGGEYRQAPRSSGERRQAPRSSERRQVPRDGGEYRQASRSSERQQTSPRRIDVIRCENCGEDYNVSYKRCPFCDERPGRGGVVGKRVANTRGGGYGRPTNPMQVVWLVVSLILIISALFIVFRFIGSPLFGGKKPSDSSSSQNSASSSQNGANSSQSSSSSNQGNTSTPSGSDPITPPDPPEPPVTEIQGTINANGGLNVRSGPGRDNGVLTTLANGTQVTILGEENGWYQIRYNGSSIGYVSKDYVSTGTASGTSTPGTTTPGTTTAPPSNQTTTTPSSGTVAAGTRGTVTGADAGLNIRSGPGREYSVVASAQNGSTVTIQGEENGWYKVTYNGSNSGYVSKDFISVR